MTRTRYVDIQMTLLEAQSVALVLCDGLMDERQVRSTLSHDGRMVRSAYRGAVKFLKALHAKKKETRKEGVN